MTDKYNYLISGSASKLYPVDTFFGLLSVSKDDVLEIPKCYPFSGEWGVPLSKHLMDKEYYPIPQFLDMVYLSIIEGKFYSIETNLLEDKIMDLWNSSKRIIKNKYIIVGMAPYGGVAVWGYEEKKSLIICWKQGKDVFVDMKDFTPLTPNISLADYCASYLKHNKQREALPPRNLFDNYMKLFTYRYLAFFEKWKKDDEEWEKYADNENVPVFDFIEESLFDGTHDKLHDGGLMKYHQAGKPKKLRVEWHIGKSEYSAYFWFEDERIREVFDKFYGAHPETKTDFIIRIDAEKRKYELALYRYGLKEPQVIPEDVYQLLVFKNKFEDYRSDNYNQERGAWIW